MKNQRFLALSLLSLALWLLGPTALQACSGANVKNLAISPACYTPGGLMTVSFQVKTCKWQTAVGSIMWSNDNNSDWDDDAIYTSNGELTTPDSNGHWGFSMETEGNPAAWHNLSYEIHVPAGYTGNKYVIVAVGENWEALQNGWGNVDDEKATSVLVPCAPAATLTPTPVVNTFTRTPSPTNTPVPGTPTHTRTVTPGGTFTSTRTPTPAPTGYQGLPIGERLYGLEYIPFPKVVSGGTFNDLSFVAAVSTNNDIARNTARYRITLQNLAGEVAVETRIGPYGVTCTTGYWNSANYTTATSLVLPPRPQNLSTTYAWVGVTVPATEQIQAVGDPRFVPYIDMLSITNNAYKDNYNWFYKNLGNSAYQDYEVEYNSLLSKAVYDRYNSQPDVDVPKLFRLWREGIYQSRSIFNSLSGYSNYYMGDGGEIGGDSANKLGHGGSADGVITVGGPYGSGSNVTTDEIIGSADLVRSASWDSLPFLGELWPDSSYTSDWSSTGTLAASTWGNLRNNQSSGVAYRDKQENVSQTGRYSFLQVKHRNSSVGCATFMNGGGGTESFNHDSISNTDEAWMDDSKVMGIDYNFAMASTFNVNRPWGLNTGGNHPPEWTIAPYDTQANLDVYPVLTSTTTTQGFYYYQAHIDADHRASAAIRGLWNNMVGWFIVSGLAPSTDSGINFVARFSIIGCLRTFHDAGAPSLNTDGVWRGTWGAAPKIQLPTSVNAINISGTNYSFRIEPIPYVQITSPTVGQDLSGQGTIRLKWKERYARWDGKRYTEKYPCVDDTDAPCVPFDTQNPGDPAREWHSLTGTALVYNIKYSEDGGTSWVSALTGGVCPAGVYQPNLDSISGNANSTYTYAWDVTALSAGTKLVRVECYRVGLEYSHYAYHELQLTLNP